MGPTIVDFRKATGTKFEAEQEQVANVKQGISEASAKAIVAIVTDTEGEMTFWNANNSPQELLWLAKMIELHALRKAGYNVE